MWEISLPNWWEFVLRAVVVYFFLLVLLRLTGKRQDGHAGPATVRFAVLENTGKLSVISMDKLVDQSEKQT